MNINCFCHHLEVYIQLVTMTYTAQWVHPTSLYWAVGKGTLCAVVPWGEALPWHEDLEDTPAYLFGFYAVDAGIQHGGNQQVDVGHDGVNERGSMLAIPVNHGQAKHGDVQDQDCQDMGQAVVQSLETLLLGCDAHNSLTSHNIWQNSKQWIQYHYEDDHS